MKRSMKVLFINDNYSHIGGAEAYLLDLQQLLNRNKNDTYIFSPGKQEIKSTDVFVAQETTLRKPLLKSKNFKDISAWLLRKSINAPGRFDAEKHGIVSPRFQEIVTKYQYIQLFGNHYIDTNIEKKLWQFINEVNPAIIHIHNNYKYPISIYSSLENTNIPVVKTVHDFGVICPTSWCVKPNGEICEGGVGENCVEAGCITNKHYSIIKPITKIVNDLEKNSVTLFIVPSKALKQKMEQHGFNNVVHIPNFVNAESYKVDFSRMEVGNVLYVGGLTKHKGVHYLIEAFPYVLKKFPGARLNIVGDGSLRSYLENRAEQLGMKACVIFHGHSSKEVIKGLYQRANVVVVPSIWMEAFGLVIIEAMASGSSVVGSKIGGISELIRDGETGYLTEPRNPEDITKKIIKILSDRNLAEKFGKNAREIAINEYSPAKHYESVMKLYQKIL
jgi:glycosyltransferase involved in cell wall biosynthesis